MDRPLTLLFALCCSVSLGLSLFVFLKDPRARVNRCFSFGTLFLLVWLATLYIFDRQGDSQTLTLLGRINIAAMLPVVAYAYLLVREVRLKPTHFTRLIWIETILLGAITLFTPLIDRKEIVTNGVHVTLFGALFFLNILHVTGYISAAVFTALFDVRTASPTVRSQLSLLGTGLFATAGIAIFCDLILPYLYHVFVFQEVGASSSLFFLSATAYAICVKHLFNIRVVIRATLVYGLLIAITLELYKALLEFLVHLLPFGDLLERHAIATATVLIINAFTHEPLRRLLERFVQRLIPRRAKPSIASNPSNINLSR